MEFIMNHYLYLITFPDGMKYVGARSTNLLPELDACYLGSGKALPKRDRDTCTKQILRIFNSREELIQAEYQYIIDNDCVNSPEYYNLRSKTFDKHGIPDTSGPLLKGRSKHTHAYIEEANKKRVLYAGENRTPAQKHRDKLATGKKLGPNPLKGHSGTDNTAFVPWYYIDSEGNYYEVLDTTKEDFAVKLGISKRQLIHRFHYSNRHKPAKVSGRVPLAIQGFTFGNLPRPTNTDTI